MAAKPKQSGPNASSGESTKERIRLAAYRCFRDGGYHETTVAALCREAQISKGAYYHHYASKQEVFLDILDTWSREVTTQLRAQFLGAVEVDNYDRSIAQALANETRRGRHIAPLWLEFAVRARREIAIQASLSRFYRRIRQGIAELLKPFIPANITPQELESVSTAIFGAYIGVVMQEICDPEETDAEAVFAHVMGVLRFAFERPDPS